MALHAGVSHSNREMLFKTSACGAFWTRGELRKPRNWIFGNYFDGGTTGFARLAENLRESRMLEIGGPAQSRAALRSMIPLVVQ